MIAEIKTRETLYLIKNISKHEIALSTNYSQT